MLKIVCQYKPNGEYYRLLGLANALTSAGHAFYFWNQERRPLIDVFDEVKPDIYVGTTYDSNRPEINTWLQYPQTKIVLKGGNWGENDDKINKNYYPILFASESDKQKMAEIKEKSGKPDFIMCHYHPNRVNETMGLWRSIGIEPIGIMNAADVIVYGKGKFDSKFESDIGFVGGYWKYKAINLDKYIVPLCSPASKVSIKVFGNQKWPIAQYCGLIEDNDVKNLYASSKICPNVSEIHSNDLGYDIVERPLKILSAGGFLLMDRVASFMEDVFTNNEVVIYDNQNDFLEKIVYFLKNPDKRNNEAAIKKVYNELTYHHRAAELLQKLGFENEAKELLVVYVKNYHINSVKG